MKFGVATVDITPPVGVSLWGYDPRESTFIEHPLRAEALACVTGTSGWILVSADIGAFSKPLADQVRNDIAQRTGLPVEAVLLAATHTHSGPHVTDALWRSSTEFESAYYRELRVRLATVAEQAWRARSPGELVHARTAAPALASNRRVQRDDGTWTNAWDDPDGRHTGYCDPTVELLGVRRPDGVLDAVLVNFGCHPVCYNSLNLGISGDYVSYLKDALESDGTVKTALFTVAGHANVDPRHCVQNHREVVRRMGEALAAIVRQAIHHLAPVGGSGVAAVNEPWKFRTTWRLDGRLTIYFPHAGHGQPVRTVLSAVTAGNCVLLGLPGETVSEYRTIFQDASPFGVTLLISLANDFVGYLPTDEILAQGAYEAAISPLNPMQAILTAKVNTILERIHSAVT